jgi:hypothetical protein
VINILHPSLNGKCGVKARQPPPSPVFHHVQGGGQGESAGQGGRQVVKHHQVFIAVAQLVLPGVAQVHLRLAFGVGQLCAFHLQQNQRALGGIKDKIRVMGDEPIQGKAAALRIAVPPKDVGQGGELGNHLMLGAVDVPILADVEGFGDAGDLAGEGDLPGQAVAVLSRTGDFACVQRIVELMLICNGKFIYISI